MPRAKRRSFSSSSCSRRPSGSHCLPPPTMTGAMNRLQSEALAAHALEAGLVDQCHSAVLVSYVAVDEASAE